VNSGGAKAIVLMVIAVVVIGSAIGVIMLGEQQAGGEDTAASEQVDTMEVARRISAYINTFASTPARPDYPPELIRLHELINSPRPVAILFWPSSCGSCSQYKDAVWLQVKALFDNVTFVDYDIDTVEGARLASLFGIDGITVVLTYNGTVYGVVYGEHLQPSQLAYLVRMLSLHVGGGR